MRSCPQEKLIMSIFVRVVGSERGKSVCEGGAEITHWTLCLLGPHYRRYGVLGGNVSEVFGFGDLDVEASRMGARATDTKKQSKDSRNTLFIAVVHYALYGCVCTSGCVSDVAHASIVVKFGKRVK